MQDTFRGAPATAFGAALVLKVGNEGEDRNEHTHIADAAGELRWEYPVDGEPRRHQQGDEHEEIATTQRTAATDQSDTLTTRLALGIGAEDKRDGGADVELGGTLDELTDVNEDTAAAVVRESEAALRVPLNELGAVDSGIRGWERSHSNFGTAFRFASSAARFLATSATMVFDWISTQVSMLIASEPSGAIHESTMPFWLTGCHEPP